MTDESDPLLDLLARARNGCQESAAQLVARYGPYVQRIVRWELQRRVRPVVDSADICQSVWAVFFTNLSEETFTSPQAFVTYLARICDHKLRQVHRRHLGTGKRTRERQEPLEVEPPDPQIPAEHVAAAKEEWEAVLRSLPPLSQQILLLLRDGHSQSEVAQRLDLSERTVARIKEEVRQLQTGADAESRV